MTDQEHNELIALYNISVGDIKDIKQRAWGTTNYIVLLHVAGVAYIDHIKPITGCERAMLFVASLIMSVLAVTVLVLGMLQNGKNRERIAAIRKHFGPQFAQCWGAYPKKNHTSPTRDLPVTLPMIGVILITALFFYHLIF